MKLVQRVHTFLSRNNTSKTQWLRADELLLEVYEELAARRVKLDGAITEYLFTDPYNGGRVNGREEGISEHEVRRQDDSTPPQVLQQLEHVFEITNSTLSLALIRPDYTQADEFLRMPTIEIPAVLGVRKRIIVYDQFIVLAFGPEPPKKEYFVALGYDLSFEGERNNPVDLMAINRNLYEFASYDQVCSLLDQIVRGRLSDRPSRPLHPFINSVVSVNRKGEIDFPITKRGAAMSEGAINIKGLYKKESGYHVDAVELLANVIKQVLDRE